MAFYSEQLALKSLDGINLPFFPKYGAIQVFGVNAPQRGTVILLLMSRYDGSRVSERRLFFSGAGYGQ
jgi:hypothetical protein